jgi:hypothetical protein
MNKFTSFCLGTIVWNCCWELSNDIDFYINNSNKSDDKFKDFDYLIF